jgi:hypothetical protein
MGVQSQTASLLSPDPRWGGECPLPRRPARPPAAAHSRWPTSRRSIARRGDPCLRRRPRPRRPCGYSPSRVRDEGLGVRWAHVARLGVSLGISPLGPR